MGAGHCDLSAVNVINVSMLRVTLRDMLLVTEQKGLSNAIFVKKVMIHFNLPGACQLHS